MIIIYWKILFWHIPVVSFISQLPPHHVVRYVWLAFGQRLHWGAKISLPHSILFPKYWNDQRKLRSVNKKKCQAIISYEKLGNELTFTTFEFQLHSPTKIFISSSHGHMISILNCWKCVIISVFTKPVVLIDICWTFEFTRNTYCYRIWARGSDQSSRAFFNYRIRIGFTINVWFWTINLAKDTVHVLISFLLTILALIAKISRTTMTLSFSIVVVNDTYPIVFTSKVEALII